MGKGVKDITALYGKAYVQKILDSIPDKQEKENSK
jgi:hypothetical protein